MADIAQKSEKHKIIDKANASMVAAISVAVFIVVFCLFAIQALISQSLYHNRVIGDKKTALRVLQQNTQSITELEEKYVAFATEPINLIGGNPNGDGPQDGDNPKIVLDSLPAEYDFPAVSSSVEKLLTEGGYPISSIGGDLDAGQDSSSGSSDGSAFPIGIPYNVSTETTAEGAQRLLQTFERSIRPFKVTTLQLEGSGSGLSVQIGLETFYQPGTGLQVTTKVVR